MYTYLSTYLTLIPKMRGVEFSPFFSVEMFFPSNIFMLSLALDMEMLIPLYWGKLKENSDVSDIFFFNLKELKRNNGKSLFKSRKKRK